MKVRLPVRRPPGPMPGARVEETFAGRLTTIRHHRHRQLASTLARYAVWALCLVLLGILVIGSLFDAVRGA
jgi:hypothetical protein